MYHILQFQINIKRAAAEKAQAQLMEQLEQLAVAHKVWVNWQVDYYERGVLSYGGYIGQDGLPVLCNAVMRQFPKYITTEVHSSKDIYKTKPKALSHL